jgi:APA family basic amino acid/polyamine antiporter
VFIIILSGIIIAIIAGFMSLDEAAALVNIGTLTAFTLVCGGVIAMRILHPELPRPFKLPFNPVIPLLGIVFCLYLMAHLAASTWKYFLTWLLIGIIVYFVYSRHHSVLQKTS